MNMELRDKLARLIVDTLAADETEPSQWVDDDIGLHEVRLDGLFNIQALADELISDGWTHAD